MIMPSASGIGSLKQSNGTTATRRSVGFRGSASTGRNRSSTTAWNIHWFATTSRMK